MVPKTTRKTNDTPVSRKLYLALELSQAEWKLGFTIGLGQAPRLRTIQARNLAGLVREIEQAKVRFGLPKEAVVLSCYEAGRDGFWLHRYLETQGVKNAVVDSASIEVNRRFRRVKTDRLDVGKLLNMLVRYHQGEPKVWSVVHTPSVEVEDQRQLHRELMALKREQTHHINRMKGLLASQGVVMEVKRDFVEELAEVRLWDGSKIGPGLRALLEREAVRLELVREQIKALEKERKELLKHSSDPAIEQVRRLLRLKGIGMNSAWVDVMEFFAWRGFHNRREVGALAGLTPTPYRSGESAKECGISKAGNRPVRALAIEIAWSWLRNQPNSQLSRWYRKWRHRRHQRRQPGETDRDRGAGPQAPDRPVALSRRRPLARRRPIEICLSYRLSGSLCLCSESWCERPVSGAGLPSWEPKYRWGRSRKASCAWCAYLIGCPVLDRHG